MQITTTTATYTIEIRDGRAIATSADFRTAGTARMNRDLGSVTETEQGVVSTAAEEERALATAKVAELPTMTHATVEDAVRSLVEFNDFIVQVRDDIAYADGPHTRAQAATVVDVTVDLADDDLSDDIVRMIDADGVEVAAVFVPPTEDREPYDAALAAAGWIALGDDRAYRA